MAKQAAKTIYLNPIEMKEFIGHMVKNNRYLQNKGKNPITVNIVGEAGIGKTSVVKQIAQEENLQIVKINLAEIEELSDLVGFPIRQFQVCKAETIVGTSITKEETTCIWIDEHAVDSYVAQGFSFTGEKRMSYCPPEWIAGKGEGGILLLDDAFRADPRFLQATMTLIDTQEYISWKLPKDWHIILTNNPSDGDYMVNEIDPAMQTRFISVNAIFDKDAWAKWAEFNQLDERCINFVLLHPELTQDQKKVNARNMTLFFNAISSIQDFNTAESLVLIQKIGEGSVGIEFTSLFVSFINNRLDKLLTPEQIYSNKWAWVEPQLRSVIGKDDKYRADIASTIAQRFVNYSLYFAEKNAVKDDMIDRIKEVSKSGAFTTDLVYKLVRDLFNGNKAKFKKMTLDADLTKIVIL